MSDVRFELYQKRSDNNKWTRFMSECCLKLFEPNCEEKKIWNDYNTILNLLVNSFKNCSWLRNTSVSCSQCWHKIEIKGLMRLDQVQDEVN